MTDKRRLADLIMGRPVNDFIAERRVAGVSWRQIKAELEQATDGQIKVQHETLRRWAGAA